MISGLGFVTASTPPNSNFEYCRCLRFPAVSLPRRCWEFEIVRRGYALLLPVCPGCKIPQYSSDENSKHLRPVRENGPRFHSCHFPPPSHLLRPPRNKFLPQPRDDAGSLFPPVQSPSRKSW